MVSVLFGLATGKVTQVSEYVVAGECQPFRADDAKLTTLI
jgi:hypothetical protein